ncbi:MAG: 2-hydroxychromene-2-carboxylate isomerase [Pseudomonadota bacterium]
MKPLECWFEFASTYSYLSVMRVEGMCAEAGVPLAWRPFLLGPVFAAQGLTDSPFNVYPVKGAYMWRDMERCAAAQGLGWRRPSGFPRGSLLAARVATGFAQAGWAGDFIRAVYVANFASDRNIDDDAVIADILGEVGQDAEKVIAHATSQPVKDALKTQTAAALEAGVFGAPTFTVGEEVFWGNDRLEMAIACATGAAASS